MNALNHLLSGPMENRGANGEPELPAATSAPTIHKNRVERARQRMQQRADR
jgi:hypothetical protein